MAWNVLQFLIGIALAAATLRDVFDTVIVPGGSRASLHVARRLVFLLLPIWRWRRRPGKGLSTSFAPLVLVLSFTVWMLLLTISFGLMALAFGSSFDPAVRSFGQAVFIVGNSLVTVGDGTVSAFGHARWVMLAAGFCGLAVMTMAVTYLLIVQGSISQRDAGIMKLRTSAGEPPSALGLLEKYARIGNQEHLEHILRDGRDWCAQVRQSHASHPSLIYFRSIGTNAGWPASLGALLDLAALIEAYLDMEDLRGLAVLLREDGTRMARDLGLLADLQVANSTPDAIDLDELERRLVAAGYPLLDPPDRERFLALRTSYSGWVNAMANHLGRPAAPLLPIDAQED